MADDAVIIAQEKPYTVDVEAGQRYAWCSCGRSATQPYCDGSHKVTGLRPHVFTPDKAETVKLCGCKHTKNGPYCDGSHKSL